VRGEWFLTSSRHGSSLLVERTRDRIDYLAWIREETQEVQEVQGPVSISSSRPQKLSTTAAKRSDLG
jgi:hypothetical protein